MRNTIDEMKPKILICFVDETAHLRFGEDILKLSSLWGGGGDAQMLAAVIRHTPSPIS